MAQISVIVPVYKVEPYIDKCVESILSQSFRDFDLVLVDDGSPDTCPQICDAYAEKDPRIAVIHKQNGGLSDARNAGIDWAMAHSDSEWLAFVDSDDFIHPDYLQIMYDAAQREAADLVICDYVRVNDQEEIIEKKHRFCQLTSDDTAQLFACMMKYWRVIPAWNKLYSKDIFSELRFRRGKIHEDEFAIHHVLWNCKKAAIINQGLYYYRTRGNSIMATETPRSKLDGLEALVERYEFCQTHRLPVMKSFPIDILSWFDKWRKAMDQEERKRFAALKKRLSDAYFSEPAYRTLKHYLGFRFPRAYQSVGRFFHGIRSNQKN